MTCGCPSLPSGCQECFSNCESYFSPLNIQRNGCIFKVPGTCVYYSGANITEANINNGDSFDVVVSKLEAYINAKSSL